MRRKISPRKLTHSLIPNAVLLLAGLASAVMMFSANPKALTPVKQAYQDIPPLSTCRTAPSQFRCYANHYDILTKQEGPVAAMKEMKGLYSSDVYVQTQCHQLTHIVGRTALDMYGALSAAYEKGDSFCWSGFYHGVTERAIGKIGAAGIKSQTNDVCKALADKNRYSFDHYNCVHGLGHGFTTVENVNLFNALKDCDVLKDSWEKTSCYGGVFMENIMTQTREGGHTDFLKADQLLYPCTAVDYQYKESCYLMQTSYALQQNSYNFPAGFALCGQADKEFVLTCYQSMGRDASGSTTSDLQRTKAYCEMGPSDDAQYNCLLGALKDFISYFHSDTQATALCHAFPAYLDRCMAEVKSYYSTF